MTQTVPATAVLGPGKTGLAIGLRVLNLDGTEYAAFATTDVAETSVLGTYRKAGGVVVPDAGGYIVWGVSGTDYAEATVESTAVNVTLWLDAAAPAMTGDAYAVVTNATYGLDKLARTGADGDTLKTLSDQIDGVGSIAGQDIADALLLAPSGVAAAGSAMALAAAILEDTGTTLPGLIAGVGAGSGTGYYSDTVDNGTSPLDGVRVQLYTAQDRVGLAYEAHTNALGVFEMWPDPGTYYRWLDLAGYSFTQDVEVEVTEP